MAMRLKRLETYGFKSFADRLTFDFEDGITAVIGPNGCGKSNVVDSIKWVVGEQSAKALRGASMDDVIFNGCSTRRPMPLAEATITFEVDGIDAGEVAITRRLTRDGQSSYYLNGKPSRLKDIRDFLLNTGIGNNAYSVIEQGRIGFILEASIKDRRGLIEEAAGIAKYKVRRKASLRRIERVDNDLERIGQVLGEVRKRLRTVSRQAETALRWKELSERLRDLRMVFALEEFGRLDGERDTHRKRITDLQEQEAGVAVRLAELEALLADADAKLLGLDDQLSGLESERSEVRSKRDVAQAQLRDARHRRNEIDEQEADDRQYLGTIGERVAKVEGDLETTRVALTKSDSEGDSELSVLYRSKREELDDILAVIDGIIRDIEGRKGREVEVLRELSTTEAKLGSLVSTRKGLADRQQRILDRSKGHQDTLTAAQAEQERAAEVVATAEATAQEAHTRLDQLIREREEAQAESERQAKEVNNLRHEFNRIEVRLNVLRDFEAKQAGVRAGVKDVLQAMNRLNGICGIVAGCFRVDKRLEVAIETALGGRAQNIITETQSAAKDAIDFLKRERRGRATFMPLDGMRGRAASIREFAKESGVIGLASELIEYDKKYQPVFDNLLGGTVICETLDHALALQRKHRTNLHLVTIDGEHIAPGGAMTGGRHKGGGDAGGLVSRKNEIARLNEQLGEAEQRQTKLKTTAEEAQKKAFELAMAVTEQNRTIQARERELGEAKAQLMKAERDRDHVQEFSANFGAELEEIRLELERIDADADELKAQNTTLLAERGAIERELAEVQTVLHQRGEERDRLQEEVGNLRVNLATTEERREALKNHLGHLERQLQELADQGQERERRIEGHEHRRAELTTTIDSNETIYSEQKARFEELSTTVTELAKERDALRSSQETERQEARSLDQRRRGLERERTELELKANEIDVRIEGLSERIFEDYDVDLAEAYGNYERPADLNLPELRRELATGEQELARMGPVNLAAIDELEEVQAREQFFAEQYDDLAAAKDKLAKIIEDLNTTCRRLFKRTFRDVRKHFQELFRKLYGGGKADLVLQLDDENPDVLEAGLDIIAQPPGKQPKSITLLSGGEKALTAIALLFAVYQTKPSPFCILDEVDAPLDESNTDVYCQMLQEFCTESQFIVITHNKRTMQYADSIYGITQQERGVSTKISVKLEDVDAQGQLVETSQGQGPFSD